MLILRNVLATLLLLVLLAIGIVGIMAYFPTIGGWGSRINAMGDNLIAAWRPKNGLFWLWLGLSFAVILTFALTVLGRRGKTQIEVQMGDGRVVILESAIRKYIRTALADLPDVTPRKIQLKHARNGLQADVYANVKTHEKLPDMERQIIRRVRGALSDDLGITSIAAVHVYIRDFEVRQKPAVVEEFRPAAAEPAMREAPVFRPKEPTPTAPLFAKEPLSAPAPAPAELFPPQSTPTSRPASEGIFAASAPSELESPGSLSLGDIDVVPSSSDFTDTPAADQQTDKSRSGFFSRWRKPKTAGTLIDMPVEQAADLTPENEVEPAADNAFLLADETRQSPEETSPDLFATESTDDKKDPFKA